MSVKTALLSLFLVSPVAMGSVEWNYSQFPSYEIDVEAQASHCEIYVNDFGIDTQGYRGSSSRTLSATIATRYGDDILNVGVVADVYEESSYRDADGERVYFSGDKTIGYLDNVLFQGWDFTGTAYVSIRIEWDSFGNSVGQRWVKGFNYFIDLKQDGLIKRLWLNDSAFPFTAADYDRATYSYSSPIWRGYGNIQYLYQDSTSPLFFARNACL